MATPIPGAKQAVPNAKKVHLPDDILEKAGVSMLLDRGQVFYANMLLQMDKQATTMPRTTLGAGVYVDGGRIHLVYDKSIWEEHGLTMDDVIYILTHEIGHCMLEHFSRRKGRNPKRWNVCTDFAVNCIIGKTKLPVLWPSHAPFNLPEDLSAEEYDKLLPKGEEGKWEWESGQGPGGKMSSEHQEDQEVNDDAAAELNREVMRQAVEKAYKSCQQGTLPGKLEGLIDKIIKNNKIDWKRQLRQIVGTAAKAYQRLSWKKQSKRFGEGSKGTLRKRALKIAVALDTSGSVPDVDIAAFIAEIMGIQKSYRGCEVHVMECDAEINKYYKLTGNRQPDRKVGGRGGTSFKPPFAFLEKKKIKPDTFIYLTDMYGDFPEKKPSYPVIWVATSDETAPFGWTIRLPAEKDRN